MQPCAVTMSDRLVRHISDLGLDLPESTVAGAPSASLSGVDIAGIVLLAALGSFVGGGVRTIVTLYTPPWAFAGTLPATFPAATFLVNVGGSLLIGVFSKLSIRFNWDPRVTALLGAGFCGGLTTMSTFAIETLQLMESRYFGTAASYFFGTAGACLLVAFVGWSLACIRE